MTARLTVDGAAACAFPLAVARAFDAMSLTSWPLPQPSACPVINSIMPELPPLYG